MSKLFFVLFLSSCLYLLIEVGIQVNQFLFKLRTIWKAAATGNPTGTFDPGFCVLATLWMLRFDILITMVKMVAVGFVIFMGVFSTKLSLFP
jgi:hypothetical protein